MLNILKALRDWVGPISDEEKEKIHNDLEGGAEPDIDYFLMIALSCVMATLGLLINNVAVIIGAMLIAPLMTPIVTMALGIVRGDFKLFFTAAEAESKGALLVIIIAVFITIFSPFTEITPEIDARILPDLLHLVIALAAGAAGAYAYSRPKLSAQLPGVAIATAILPPLATIGIGLGTKRFDIALGALLMFLTNLIAINLASTIVFWVLGIGPKRRGEKEEELKDTLKKTIILLVLIAIPLTWIMITTLDEMNTKKTIEETIDARLLGMYQTELTGFDYKTTDGTVHVEATIKTADKVDSEDIYIMKNALQEKLGKPVELTIEIIELEVFETKEN